MESPRILVILVPEKNGKENEYTGSGLIEKLKVNGYDVFIPESAVNGENRDNIKNEIRKTLSTRNEGSTLMLGAGKSSTLVLELMIENHDAVFAAVVVSPPFREDYLYSLSKIERPLLIINGASDTDGIREGRKYHDYIEDSLHKVMKKAGKNPHTEIPERFFITMNKFLQDEF